jgi:hypothetical protein
LESIWTGIFIGTYHIVRSLYGLICTNFASPSRAHFFLRASRGGRTSAPESFSASIKRTLQLLKLTSITLLKELEPSLLRYKAKASL